MKRIMRWLVAAVVMGLTHVATAPAQYSLTATPYQIGSYGFSENINVGWGIAGKGWGFQWNGGNAVAPFGPNDPNANAQFGGAFGGGPYKGFFRLTAGQAADSSLVSQTPSVVVPNGGVGFISDTTQRPFVTGVVPVVGQPYFATPLQEKLSRWNAAAHEAESRYRESAPRGDELKIGLATGGGAGGGSAPAGKSSAERGVASVAEIREAQQSAASVVDRELAELIATAEAHVQARKWHAARYAYQQALRRSTGDGRPALQAKLAEVEAAISSGGAKLADRTADKK